MLEAVQVLYFLTDAHRELKKKELATITIRTILEKYAEDPKHGCANADEAENILRKHRGFLLAEMIKEEAIAWSKTQTFKRVKQIAKEMKKEEDATMHDETTLNDTLLQDSSTPLSATPDAHSAQLRPAGKGKSSLRPLSAKIALKAEGRRQSAMDSLVTDVSMTDVGDGESTMPTCSAAILTTKEEHHNKRKAAADRRAERLTKRQKLDDQTQKQQIIEVPLDPRSEAGAAEIPLPLKTSPTKPASRIRSRPQKKPAHQVHIIEQALPSFLATEANGVWRCSFDGCTHTVYGVTEENEDAKLLIKEHYKKHAIESQAKLDLIYKEERPYLPVNNLVKRIRELAAAKQAADTGRTATDSMNGMYPYVDTKAGAKDIDYPKPIVQAGY